MDRGRVSVGLGCLCGRFAPTQARKALWAGLGWHCVNGWARARSRRDLAVGCSTRDTQAISPPTGSLSTQTEMDIYIIISMIYVH